MTMPSPDIVTKRIHVGGLTPSITTAHIKDRFKSFGNVLDVEEMKADALGQPRPFTFFTIQTTPPQLVKCLNIMSGSMWRGCQLRLAEAKPKYDVRLDKERNPTQQEIDDRIRKRKRRAETTRAADVGKEAQDMRIPDESNCKTKKFWTVDSNGHLIRPVTLRPTHPLPRPTEAPKSLKADPKKTRRNPPTRLNMRVLKTSRWNPTHLTEDSLEGAVEVPRAQAGWEYESASEDEGVEGDRVLAGRWRRMMDGEDEDEEVEEVWVTRRVVPEHEAAEEDEDSVHRQDRAEGSRSASPLFASRAPARSASPMFPDRQVERSASPMFPTRQIERSASPLVAQQDRPQDESAPSVINSPAPSDDDMGFPTAGTSANRSLSRSASTLFATRKPRPVAATHKVPAAKATAPPPKVTAEPPAPIAIKETSLPDPVRDAARAERSRDLGLLASFLGEDVSIAAKPTRGEWAGFDEDDDEDEEESVPLRIRGGRADPEEEDEDEEMDDPSSSSSESSDDSSSDSSDSDGEDAPAATAIPAPSIPTKTPASEKSAEPAPVAPQSKTQSALKAMFAPAPATSSFSLLGALDADIELDEELDIPLAPPPVRQVYEPAAELQPLAASRKSHFDPDPSIPLFFPSFGKGGKDAMKEDREKEGYTGFWKQETDEEMKEIWERDKGDLTRDWKKRYRDGKKQRKRRGGGQDVD